jgi:hypothetical protein
LPEHHQADAGDGQGGEDDYGFGKVGFSWLFLLFGIGLALPV